MIKDYIAIQLMGLLLLIAGIIDIFAFQKTAWGVWLTVAGCILIPWGRYARKRAIR